MTNSHVLKDLRVVKTKKALCEALFKMLRSQNFNGITVHELCAEALVSRAAFYSHFHDKYDLLNYVLSEIHKDTVKDVSKYIELEAKVNQFVNSNKKVISNILKDANKETLAIIRAFIVSVFDLSPSQQHTVLSNFFAGGLLNLLTWMAENNFPAEVSVINSYLYRMLEAIIIWDAALDTDSAT